MRKLRFDLNIDPSALLAPNAEAFYAQAYLGSTEIADNFRTLPGIKSATKLANGMAVIADYYFKEFRLPGVIPYNTPNEFYDIIDEIIKGNIDKVSLVKEGRKHLNEVLHIDLLNQQRYKILKGL